MVTRCQIQPSQPVIYVVKYQWAYKKSRQDEIVMLFPDKLHLSINISFSYPNISLNRSKCVIFTCNETRHICSDILLLHISHLVSQLLLFGGLAKNTYLQLISLWVSCGSIFSQQLEWQMFTIYNDLDNFPET